MFVFKNRHLIYFIRRSIHYSFEILLSPEFIHDVKGQIHLNPGSFSVVNTDVLKLLTQMTGGGNLTQRTAVRVARVSEIQSAPCEWAGTLLKHSYT